MPIRLLFKGLPIAGKIGIAIGLLVAILSILGGTFYAGLSKGKSISGVVIAQYESKISDLNSKLTAANGKTTIKYVTQYLDRDKIITQTVVKNHDVIKTFVPEQFKFSQGWVYAYNQSIFGLPIDPAKAAVDTASTVTDRVGLQKVNENNGVCLANANQLDKLSGWVQETKTNGDKTK